MPLHRHLWIGIGLMGTLLLPQSLSAQISLRGSLGPGMVLQRQEPIPLGGRAPAGRWLHVQLAGMKDSTLSDPQGSWEVMLPALEAGGPYELSIRSESDSLRVSEVYIGDVWLASGQSNMAWPLSSSLLGAEEIASSDKPQIRQFLVNRRLANEQQEVPPQGSAWMPVHPDHSGEFSAVAYYFAKYLHAELDIPIGIVNASYGGSRIESWMSEALLGYDEEDISLGDKAFNQATVCYNAMIHPLRHSPVKGVIWYQGESNMGSRENALMYEGQLKTLITGWRDLWNRQDLPFIWVQLPNIGTEATESMPGTWDALPMLRAAMSRVRSLPHTAEVIAIDLGEVDIHPTHKEPVGERLALQARKLVYGESELHAASPRLKGHRKLDGGVLELEFEHLADSLVATGSPDGSLRWFAMAGANGVFYQAEARIENKRVLVSRQGMPQPAFLRYAWEHNPPNTNLYNSAGLPAAPFMLEVNHPGFQLNYFRAKTLLIKRGESTQLTWHWKGTQQVWLNGQPVDSIGGVRVWPLRDSTFTLLARDRETGTKMDSARVVIRVLQPDPRVSISSHAGPWLPMGEAQRIQASAWHPMGGSIARMELFINGDRVYEADSAAISFDWIPAVAGTYQVHARATTEAAAQASSDTLSFRADHFEQLRLEAEEGRIRGGNRLREDARASEGRYVELTRDWTLDFAEVALDSAQTCQLTFAFLVESLTSRLQSLDINGKGPGDFFFAGQPLDTWVGQHLLWPLDSGINQLSLEANWGYLSLDYLEVLYLPSEAADTLTSVDARASPPAFRIWPNPAGAQLILELDAFQGHLHRLEILDLHGRLMLQKEIHPGHQAPKRHLLHLDQLAPGAYVLVLRGSQASSRGIFLKE